MVKHNITVRIPNPHKSDISKELLAEILRQAAIEKVNGNSYKLERVIQKY